MKKHAIQFSTLFFFLAVSMAFISNQHKNKKQNKSAKTTTVPAAGNYTRQWLLVDSLANKGLNKSALEAVMNIYKKAKAGNDAAQLVKAVIHRMKFENYTEEDVVKNNIADLKKEIDESHFPARPVLHSLLAETYWRFYQQNRSIFLDRTETVAYKNDDINTWDLKKILAEAIHEYAMSLIEEDSSKRTQINIYDDVIEKGKPEESRKLRPSLFDFLAHRALDFYKNDETGLTEPANKFEINSAFYLSEADGFANIALVSEDSLSLKFNAIRLLQKLISIHNEDAHPAALIDVNLERLQFVYRHLVISNKDSLYMKALKAIELRYKDFPGSTDVLYEMALLNNAWGSRYAFGEKPEAKFLIKKAKEFCDAAIARFPYSHGGLNCKYLESVIEARSMAFTIEQVNIPSLPFPAKLEYKNLKKIYFRIAKNDSNELLDNTNLYGEKLIKHYLKLPAITQWSIDVEDDGDYQSHSAEIKIPELPLGNYILLSASDPDFTYEKNAVAYATFWNSNISYVSRATEAGGYDFYLLNRETGEPLNDVSAKLYVQQYNPALRKYEYSKINTLSTNSDGYFSIESVSEYRNFNIEFTKGSDRLFLKDNFYQYTDRRNQSKIRQQTFFFTDRSIYRPGQTVYFKGIIIQKEDDKSTIKTKQSTAVTFFDANGQKIADQNFTTNEYGTFSGSFIAPMGLLNGMMSISNEDGSVSFSVEEYKRPKFEVKYEPVSGVYRLNDIVSVNGKAISYSGAAVDNAQVQYRVVRTALFPYWFSYWRGYPSSQTMEIIHGTTTSNDQGEFTVSFNALPDLGISKESKPVFNYTINADVTDINGETQSGSQNVSVGYQALLLSVNLPQEVNRESAKSFIIGTHNLSGAFVPSSGNIIITKLKEPSRLLRKRKWAKSEKQQLTRDEFEKNFPYDIYSDEDNPEKRESETSVYNSLFDTGKDTSLRIPAMNEWMQGSYKLEATSKDKYNEEVKLIKYFTLFSARERQTATNSIDRFSVLKDNAEPGGTDQFLIGTHDKNVKVLYEIEQQNKIISKEWFTLNDEQRLIEVPVLEAYRGNIAIHFTFVKHNRDYHFNHVLSVPYTNKDLDISFETFRSKLFPGQKEEWKVKIKGRNGEKVAAEMLATMYDASLDAFRPHSWLFNIYNFYYSTLELKPYRSFGIENSNLFSIGWNVYQPQNFRTYDQLNWFGFNYYYGYRSGGALLYEQYDAVTVNGLPQTGKRIEAMAASVMAVDNAMPAKKRNRVGSRDNSESDKDNADETTAKSQGLSTIKGRTNFNETAFFYPHLITNDSGVVTISFSIPEALTRWKMMGFATTADLKYGMIEKELITQKELMVIPDPPRFFREGDRIFFSTKITNLSDTSLTGTAKLLFYDAITLNPIAPSRLGITTDEVAFTASKGQSAIAEWKLNIPEGIGAITYKVVAKAGNYSDGEEQTIPVLSNRMMVTEALPLPVRGGQNKTFELTKLKNSGTSTTIRNHKLTLEFTSNPAWYAVQALPYMMEFPYECSEQIFARYYANAIASHIANSSPKIKAVFDSWKTQSPQAFLSNLEKNQELKTLMLEQTPWLLDAKDETERKKRLALLFDLNKMSNELNGALLKLQKKQMSNGAWPWFEGMPDDRFITQYIVEGFGHLDHLGIKLIHEDQKIWNMVQRAVQYLDARIKDDYDRLLTLKPDISKDLLSSTQIQYLYARSYFKDMPIAGDSKKAFDFYLSQCKKYWLGNVEYLQGMIALTLHRYDDKSTPEDILKSLKENSQNNEELGMYWKNNIGGYYWTQAPVETQALLIEAFDEINNDQKAVDDMKVWLLKQKQTQDWKTTKATAEACYALLLKGTNWLTESSIAEITVGGKRINPGEMPEVKAEAGTGYFKTSWSGSEIKPEMATVKVENKNNVVAWGALYWQYFEQLDKITPHQTPLNLKKELFIERPSPTGQVIAPVTEQTILKPGDRIKVRIELRADRDMEYVMMKDMRAAGFEPEHVLSQYKWQDGLGYYETTHDASVDFFFSYLQKGTYVFEYPLRVTHNGNFSNGITEIECMYAPEFGAHSDGIRVKVGE